MGETGSCADGWGHLSKTLIQLSVDGRGCVPSLLFTWANYGGGNEDNGTSFKRSHACSATLTVPNFAAGHHQPTPPLETPGHSLASLGQFLVGSLLLSPGPWFTQSSVCALQESISQSCVSSGSSMVQLVLTSSKRAYAIPRSAAPRAPISVAVHC